MPPIDFSQARVSLFDGRFVICGREKAAPAIAAATHTASTETTTALTISAETTGACSVAIPTAASKCSMCDRRRDTALVEESGQLLVYVGRVTHNDAIWKHAEQHRLPIGQPAVPLRVG